MIRALVCALLLVATPVAASQIVPVTVQTPGGFGPGLPVPPGCVAGSSTFSVKCFAVVPPGSAEIVGWTGFWWVIGGPVVYIAAQPFHDGGTQHLLDAGWIASPPPAAQPFPPVFYPAGSGHKAIPGDLVWAEFFCAGGAGSRCAAATTFHFRVP